MEKQPASRTCFVCGRQNRISLKMEWYNDREEKCVVSKITIPEAYNGYPGFVHGGIVAAILDETAGRALMVDGDFDILMVTASLNIKYLLPTPTNTPLRVKGWLVKGNAQRAKVKANLELEDGTITAKCDAVVVKPPREYFAAWKWESEKEHWRVYEEDQ